MDTETTREVQKTDRSQGSTALEQTRPGPVYMPAVDIFENNDRITILADMPGVTADDLNIDLEDNVLTMTGDVVGSESSEETVVVREYDAGRFYRQFRVSEQIDRDGINASLTDGVLRLDLPKAAASKPRKIEIKTG